jgi:hypothetical protein
VSTHSSFGCYLTKMADWKRKKKKTFRTKVVERGAWGTRLFSHCPFTQVLTGFETNRMVTLCLCTIPYACINTQQHFFRTDAKIAEWSTSAEVKVEVNLRPTVSRPVCLGVRRPPGTFDQFFFLLEFPFRHLRVCYFVAPSLTRGRVCNLLYNCF